MQIYEGKSEKYFIFAREMRGFGSKEWMDSENYSDNNAARRL